MGIQVRAQVASAEGPIPSPVEPETHPSACFHVVSQPPSAPVLAPSGANYVPNSSRFPISPLFILPPEQAITKALGGIFHTERRELTGAGRSIVTRSSPFETIRLASRCSFDVLE